MLSINVLILHNESLPNSDLHLLDFLFHGPFGVKLRTPNAVSTISTKSFAR
ncbi:unnamed protein product [Schistosoma mattheei]|uniref:Uncharacterized protein n=1 Tax=Schistosoma mattheei TaxID=31246 RepID=A0A183PQ55_9TREM|nr:unnamed protein product [Schistosoma mattheei]